MSSSANNNAAPTAPNTSTPMDASVTDTGNAPITPVASRVVDPTNALNAADTPVPNVRLNLNATVEANIVATTEPVTVTPTSNRAGSVAGLNTPTTTPVAPMAGPAMNFILRNPGTVSGAPAPAYSNMINISMFRAIRPADMIAPSPQEACRPWFVISAALFLGLLNQEQVDRVRISTSREFRCHQFPNWEEAFRFYRGFYYANVLRLAPTDEAINVLAAMYGGYQIPTERSGLAPNAIHRDPWLAAATALATASESVEMGGRSSGPYCTRCGIAIAAQGSRPTAPTASGSGSSQSPIVVPSTAPTPDLSSRPFRARRSVPFVNQNPPMAPRRAPAPALASAAPQVSPSPLPRDPRPFPMPPPTHEVVEIPSDDEEEPEPPQPSKKAKIDETKADKGKGKERSKRHPGPDSLWSKNSRQPPAQGSGGASGLPSDCRLPPLPSLGPSISTNGSSALAPSTSTSNSPAVAPASPQQASQSASTGSLKRKAGQSNVGGSGPSKGSSAYKRNDKAFLRHINSAMRAELAFRAMGNKPNDPDVLTPPTSSGSSLSSSSSSPLSSISAASAPVEPIASPAPAALVASASTVPATPVTPTSVRPAPPDQTSPPPTRAPNLINVLLDAAAHLAGNVVGNVAGAGPSTVAGPTNGAGTGNVVGNVTGAGPSNGAGTGNVAGAGPSNGAGPGDVAGAGNGAGAGNVAVSAEDINPTETARSSPSETDLSSDIDPEEWDRVMSQY